MNLHTTLSNEQIAAMDETMSSSNLTSGDLDRAQREREAAFEDAWQRAQSESEWHPLSAGESAVFFAVVSLAAVVLWAVMSWVLA